jgi:hypothetical protein
MGFINSLLGHIAGAYASNVLFILSFIIALLILVPVFWFLSKFFPKFANNLFTEGTKTRLVFGIICGILFWTLIPWAVFSLFFLIVD